MHENERDRTVSVEAGGTGFADIIKLVRSQGYFVSTCAALGFALMILASIAAKPEYTVQTVIMPPPDGGSQALLSQLGPLASAASSLTGLRLGGGDDPSFQALRQLLESPRLYEEMERRHQILKLFYALRWDNERNTWKNEKNFLRTSIDSVKEMLQLPIYDQPTINDLGLLLERRLRITQIGFTQLYDVSLRYKDPVLAAQFLNWAIETGDSLVRADTVTRIQGQVDYIIQRLKVVTVQEHRQALSNLLLALERQGMLVSGGGNFSAVVLQAPTVVIRPSLRGVVATWLLGLLGGAVLATGLVLVFTKTTRAINAGIASVVTFGRNGRTGKTAYNAR
jgi:hypothetical protein